MPRTSKLSIEMLEAFHTLMRHNGSATDAARALGINQPSMSKRLMHLQNVGKLLERPWLQRQGKALKLTDEGTHVLPVVDRMMEDYHRLIGFTGKRQPLRPMLRFACGQLAVAGLVKDALHEFRRKFKDVQIWISTMRGSDRIAGVATGALDMALVTHSEQDIRAVAKRELHVEKIEEARLALVTIKGSRWAGKLNRLPARTPVPLRKLAGFPLIMPERDADIRQVIDAAIERDPEVGKLRIELEIGGWPIIMSYVQAGIGVGVVSEAAIPKSERMLVRYLDPAVCAPSESRLICRRIPGVGSQLDLNDHAVAWRDILIKIARQRGHRAD